ncbi:MAG TPA: AbrB/MazE/SpoVT family DNA-binding domain-containing protein [Candidatus Limnocylindria bacterium]|nr:AbrB/MazE/SpoVT family DNA-binding domain-containing protein [Candidatus Limnocylindria bacterium]
MARQVKNSRGPRGTTTVSSKHQVTIPKAAMTGSGFRAGDRLRAVVRGRGQVLLVREDDPVERHAGRLSGVYGPRELDELRDEWR